MEALIEFGTEYYGKQDYMAGKIVQDGKVVSEMKGNYMGYMDFDGVRYWDVREID